MLDDGKTLREQVRAAYSETAAEHILRPRNLCGRGGPEGGVARPDGVGVAGSGCGETVKVWLELARGRVSRAGFWTDGCAATVACGSMATELALGKPVAEALAVDALAIADALDGLPAGNLHCAELAARALGAALRDCLATAREPWKKLYRK